MDLTTLKIGDRIRLLVGHTAVISDLSQVPNAVGCHSCNDSKRPIIFWPAGCVISCAEAESRAKIARNIISTVKPTRVILLPAESKTPEKVPAAASSPLPAPTRVLKI